MSEFDPNESAVNGVKHGIDFDAAQALWIGRRSGGCASALAA
jgi:hypothetical protein